MDDDAELMAQCQARLGCQLGGKWTLESLVGVGGMAAVYSARHRNGAVAAIKMLHPELAGLQELRQRFLREAYIANKVDHVGSVKVLDDDQTENGEPYIVMELLKGTSVESYARRAGGRLPLGPTLNITDQLLAVLDKAHAAGVIHRDLKPDNLFLTEEGVVKVLDFGIARLREGNEAKKTQTGMMMGTPAFMAPEQALGRWSEVDGRTDLWAVGAIMFTLLTGRAVHEATTANEMLIYAATRPAASLARYVQAPVRLVRLVDRALEFDRTRRFASAAEMRAELHAFVQEVRAPAQNAAPRAAVMEAKASREGVPTPSPAGGPAAQTVAAARSAEPPAVAERSSPAEAAAPDATATLAEVRDRGPSESYDVSFATENDIKNMVELFTSVERTLVASVQYGPNHPEVSKRWDRVFAQVGSALMHVEVALVWNLTPYSFVVREHTIWEPKPPLDRIPYQLFSDGLRLLALTPGLTEHEFKSFLHILTLDRAREMAPEDDFVTMLWEADFEHIVHQAIDNFAEGDQQQRAKFERDVAEVVRLAQLPSPELLQEGWRESRESRAPAVEQKVRKLATVLAGSDRLDTEAAARAAAVRMRDAKPDDPVDMQRALHADPAFLTMVGARFTPETPLLSERFALAVALGYREARRAGNEQGLAAPLRSAIDGLAEREPATAIDMIASLCEALERIGSPKEAEQLRAALTGQIVSKKTIELILTGALAEGADQALFARGLRQVLGYVDGTHVPIAVKVLISLTDPEIRDIVIAYCTRTGRGHEAELGALFGEADLELGLALVRVLAALHTPEAKNAIASAISSPHAMVRIEALGHVEGASSERLRLELRALIEDRHEDVRVAALRTMEQYSIRVAGPFLVLRIKSAVFDKLSLEERRTALSTLAALATKRAEAVCVELLADSRMMRSEAHEITREVAAETLGRIASSDDTRKRLEEAASQRWFSSERVRIAASKALNHISSRSVPPAAAAQRR